MHRLLTCLPLSKVPQKVMGTYVLYRVSTWVRTQVSVFNCKASRSSFFCACPARHGARHRRAAAAARSPRLRCQLFGRGAGGAGCRSEEHAALCKRATGSVWCEVSVAESQQQLIASSTPGARWVHPLFLLQSRLLAQLQFRRLHRRWRRRRIKRSDDDGDKTKKKRIVGTPKRSRPLLSSIVSSFSLCVSNACMSCCITYVYVRRHSMARIPAPLAYA